ncbi:MAG: hypothetical protein HUJ26_00695 [Planctomycetaceae bacterium]|nr:hypothetical protein [Planctomycetaceae bacterium]
MSFPYQRFLTGLIFLLGLGAGFLNAESEFRTGREFDDRLDEPGVASLSGLSLKETLQQIEQSYGLACFRDRRIDPEQIIELSESRGSVRDLLNRIGESAGCRVSLTGQVVYVGPEIQTRLLRSLMAQRQLDLKRVFRNRPGPAWTRSQDYAWPILSEPRNLVLELAEFVGVAVKNPEAIEHDVWSAGVIPDATPVELFSILLLGFDLTFELSRDGESMTLVPLPETSELMLSDVYTLKSGEDPEDWQRMAPAAEISVRGRRVTVTGLVEDHAAIRDFRSGRRKLQGEDSIALIPLSKRLFTLTLRDVPASAVLTELQKSGVHFVWDAKSFAAAEIDLNTLVEINVKEASAEEFFQALLTPLGIAFDLSGVTVTMRPKD